jgi:hypothetical protein
MVKYTVGQFSHKGETRDYTGDGYEIDDEYLYKKNKKLAIYENGSVGLCRPGIKPLFVSLIRLYLAVTSPLLPEIEYTSGVRISDYEPRIVYAWETAADRENLTNMNMKKLDSKGHVWRKCVRFAHHIDGTTTTLFDKYEVNQKTRIVRNISTKKELRPTKNGQVCLYDANNKMKNVYVRQVYMATYHGTDRRPNQTEIDHINGNHNDDEAWNWRWVSHSENNMLKFKWPADQVKLPKYNGDLSLLHRFETSDVYCGYIDDGRYAIVGPNRDLRCVGDFRVTDRHPYPTIKIKGKMYQVHKVVAYAEGLITRDKFYSGVEGVVEHKDTDKTNFEITNLRDGTSESNNLATQNNPATTSRKRVRRTHLEHGTIVEYESRKAAAAANDCHGTSITRAIRNTTWRGYSWEFIENTIIV